jgi:osmoprotectant transport system permease protein
MNQLLAFISDPRNDFLGQTIVYLQLCGLAIVLAIVIGVGIGIAVSRSALLGFIAVNVSGLLRAIPILAVLILAVPYLGLGFTPAAFALVIVGVPPILLNTYTGVRGIDPATIDAARGMGMTRGQIVSRIQIPLILPVVAAGIRTSAVQIIATATVAGLIGAGGYGNYVIDGLYKLNDIEILAGAIPVAILAMLIELLMGRLQQAITPAGLRVNTPRTVAVASARAA